MTQKRVNSAPPTRNLIANVIQNSIWLFSGQGVTAVLSFFYLAIVTRTLGVVQYGTFVLIVSVVQLLANSMRFQTWQSVVKYGYLNSHESGKQSFSQISWHCLLWEIGGGIMGVFICLLLIGPLSNLFGWPESYNMTIAVFAVMMLLSIRSTALGILRANDRFRDGAVADAMIPIGRMVGALVVLATQPTLANFLMAWACAEVLSMLIFWLFVVRQKLLGTAGLDLRSVLMVPAKHRDLLSFFMNMNVINLIRSAKEHLTVLIVGAGVGEVAAGLYRLAAQLANSVYKLSETVARPLLAEMAFAHGNGDIHGFRGLFMKSVRVSVVTGIIFAIFLVLIGKYIILLLAGSDYLGAYPVLVLLGMAGAVTLMGVGLDPLLQSSGKAGVSMAIGMAGLLGIVAGLYLVLEPYGIIGAAAVICLVSTCTMLALALACWRQVKALQD